MSKSEFQQEQERKREAKSSFYSNWKESHMQEADRKSKLEWYTSWILFMSVIATMVILIVTCDWKIL